MKTRNILASACMMLAMGVATEVSAATKIMYTTPIYENMTSDSFSRISCSALNLDKKVQNVRAEVIAGDGVTILNDKTEALNPGEVKRIAYMSLGTPDSVYCKFTINSTKVRPYVNVYDKDWHLVFVMDAK